MIPPKKLKTETKVISAVTGFQLSLSSVSGEDFRQVAMVMPSRNSL